MTYYDTSYPPSLWGGGTGPDPSITSIAPTGAVAGSGPVTITVTGTNFVSGSVVEVDQSARPTTFVSATSLTATYDPLVAGAKVVTVRNPNEEESNNTPFTVTAAARRETA